MLVLTIDPGESLMAREHFELLYHGLASGDRPEFSLVLVSSGTYVIGRGNGVYARYVQSGQRERFLLYWQSYLRVGDIVLKFSHASRGRVRIAVDAPRHIQISRPAQHGGSLLAG